MSLGSPWMLLLLPLVALTGWLMARARRLQVEAACRLKGAALQERSAFLTRRDWLWMAALVCVVVALARPRWSPQPYELERRGRDLVIALDVSRSMLAADVFPSRLEMARITIHEALPALAGQRVALVTFAGTASVRVPLTLDHQFVRYMLERADPSDIDTGSTSLQAAVEKVIDTVLTDAAGGRRDLVVFTDGEDHLSDIDKTADMLAQCGARVLIIGLGDPARGARVPDPRDDGQWMRHDGAEVVSRLQERTLEELADRGPNVTYYPARTRPFDLMSLYRRLIAGSSDDSVVGGLQQVRYTEGYPYLAALAVVLWLAPSSLRVPAARGLVLLVLLLPGCTRQGEDESKAAFQARVTQGTQLQGFAQELAGADSSAERSLLVEAREQFLRAALLKQGDVETARQITTITRRLREVESAIEQQRAEEKQRREKLSVTVQRLEQLAAQQEGLALQSRRMMRRRVPLSEADYNLPESETAGRQLPPQRELNRVAPQFAKEQKSVREATVSVLDSLRLQQNTLRDILTRAYGEVSRLPATEVDPVVDLLAGSVSEQETVLANLKPGAVRWPKANTALHTAAGRMQQALDSLRSLLPPKTDEDDDATASRNEGDYDEEMEGLDSESRDSKAKPVSPGDFREALSLRSLPIPDYTAADIMTEEAANQQKRARQKAARAGARVEKNW